MAGGVRLSRARAVAWPLLCALATVGALLAWPADRALLSWQPALAGTQPWRWWTAALVHWTPLHLGANLAGTLAVAALGVAAGCGPRAVAAWALAWPLSQLALLAQPALQRYGGLSGVLHAAVAVASVQLLFGPPGRRRQVGAALLAGLLLKVVSEAPWQGALRQVPGWDLPIAPLAHAGGVAAGLLCALALRPWRAPA